MIDNNIIKEAYGIVGWKQPTISGSPVLDSDNLKSESGYIINDNPSAKLSYLYDTHENSGSITDEEFNQFLKDMQINAIQKVCDSVFQNQDNIDNAKLFVYPNNKQDTITPSGFCGMRLVVANKRDAAINISRITFEFAETGTIRLLLFDANRKTVYKNKDIEITSDYQTEEIGWKLLTGEYYLGYISNLKSYKREYELAEIESNVRNLYVETGSVNHTSESNIFDLDRWETTEENWGLNPEFESYYDQSQIFMRNRRRFAYAIKLQMVNDVMEHIITSNQSNQNQRFAADMVKFITIQLYGSSELRDRGKKKDLEIELNRLKNEVEKLQKGFTKQGIRVITVK